MYVCYLKCGYYAEQIAFSEDLISEDTVLMGNILAECIVYVPRIYMGIVGCVIVFPSGNVRKQFVRKPYD